MHRSGTSVITQLFSLAGARLPGELVGATESNEFGHWEPVWLNDRDDRLLRDLGTAWSEWSRIDLDTVPSDLVSAYVSDLRGFVQKEIGDSPLLVLKEPRTCRFLNAVLRALDADQIEPLIVIPYRNPLEVAGSLQARDGMTLREGILLWLRHILDAERDSRGRRRSFVTYDSLFVDWRGEFARISADLEMVWPNDLDAIAPDVDEAIVKGARHNRWLHQDLVDTSYTSGLALRVFNACQLLLANPNDPAALAALDLAREQFEDLVELTHLPLVTVRQGLEEARIEVEGLTQRNSELSGENDEVRHNLKAIWELHDIVSELNKNNESFISSLRAQLEEKQGQLTSEQESSARAGQEMQSLRSQLSDVRTEADHLAQGVRDHLNEIAGLATRIDDIYASRSWRVTGPLRLLGGAARNPVKSLRKLARKLLFAVWKLLPLTASQRIAMKNRVLSSTAGRKLFGTTEFYANWKNLQIMRFDAPSSAPSKSRKGQSADRFLTAGADAANGDDGKGWVEVDTDDHFVPRRIQSDLTDPTARLICFYLPQFHAIPENDAWWGEGFTEWTNVRPARPMFPGHYQPHVPLDIGYYDLTDINAQKRQIELAKLYGVGGFCFYWYWFGGKRLLEKPVEQWLENPELDFPFCICWANENWTRRWDGMESEVIMGQNHSPEDDIAFIAELGGYLKDPRYIRIDGKPLILVYRPKLLPDAAETAGRWRDWCRANGIGEIYLAYTQSFELDDPRNYGFDAAIEFPPNNASPTVLTERIEGLDPEFTGIVYDWNSYVDRSRNYPQPDYRLFRSVCPAWDNTARRKTGGAIFLNNTPAQYGAWLGNALTRTLADAPTRDERIIFCNAWNEWAEGAHLEPDTRFGYAWLETTRNALDPRTMPRHVTLVGHDAHPHGAQLLLLNLARTYWQAGIRVKVLLLAGGELISEYEKVAAVAQLPDPVNQRDEVLRLLRGLRNEHDEVAIVNTAVSGSAVGLLQEAGYRPVSLIHEMRSVYSQHSLTRQLRDIASAGAPVVFPANIVREHFEEELGRKLDTAVLRPQGMYLRPAPRDDAARSTLRAEYGIPENAPLVLGVGYMDRRKGVDLFLRTVATMREAGVPAEAIWIGHADRDELPRLEALAREVGVADHVRFPGRQPSAARFYAAADLFLLPSREDPYPSVVLEAMAAEAPVVMFSGTTGSEDLARRGLAIAVPAEDVAAMASAAMRVLSDATETRAMVSAAARHVAEETCFTEYAFDLLKLAGRDVPRISVIVPNYNYAQYIRARIETVAAQDMPILEIIVLDDASTDRSAEVIAELVATSPAPLRFVPGEVNSGNVFKQWQKGLDLARGDYIWIAEADDLAEPEFLSTVMRGFESGNVVLSYCESAQMDGEGNPLAADYRYYTNPIAPGKWEGNYVSEGQREIEQALFLKNTILNASAVVMRADALREVFAENREEIEGLRFAGDWAIYLNLLAKGDIAYSSLSLNHHRRHQSSVTLANFDERQLGEIKAMQEKARQVIGTDPVRESRADAYIDELEHQFGLKPARLKAGA